MDVTLNIYSFMEGSFESDITVGPEFLPYSLRITIDG